MRFKMKQKITLLFFLLPLFLFAQPTPAPKQTEPILISGGTIHVGDGRVLENHLIAINGGKIEMVVSQTVGQGFPNYKIIDATGKHIYPGFIAPATVLGLVEIESVRATIDHTETGELNPNARAIIAYNTDSEVIPTVRGNGVLMSQIIPLGGTLSGQSSVVQLDAWNWEDAAYKTDEGVMLNWASAYSNSGWWAEPGDTHKNERYNEQVLRLTKLFDEAQAYAKKEIVTEKNLRLEAMKGLFDGSKKLYIHVSYAKAIVEAVVFAKKYNLQPTIVGGEDAYLITNFLKENNVAVILHRVQSLPMRTDDDYDQPYKNAIALQNAGIRYCLSMDGGWQQRNLPFQAGQAVGAGLDYEKAVGAISLNAAKILGIDKICGSIEQGKEATLFISEGDALDMRTNKVTQAFIQGRNVILDDKQKLLYRRFQEKYKQKK
jgi:imidazolonepropionase-like amidohydrolase